ncbi:hypothetical protein B4O97_03415 [Marispirochaeta aestuarii]|uniref:Uncharacterized protein n=1 Tax=Marispirochaeta aestuarii TaxID=1963862 RepID=A0A1Y1S197_9SPIO|nr:hypothetical protein [Marispirochaeta aestuarii]ORC37251.1 hypothetical protein B4O97_03415 [Marispirochaeta aestuarii]
MLTWALIATLLSGGGFFLWIKQLKHTAGIVKERDIERREHRKEVHRLTEEVRRRDHIIHAIEEVNRDTAKKKRKIRNSDHPARSATDIMHKLAADSDGNDTPAGD